MDEIIKILKAVIPGADITPDTDLISEGYMKSMTVMSISARLMDEFDVEITPVDIIPENFRTPAAIKSMIDRLDE